MSFFNTNAKPARSKRPLGIDERRTAQHEQAMPIPVFWGTQRFGVTSLCEPFDRETKPAKGQKKAGKSGGVNYASVAFAISHGPIDSLRSLWVDQDLWWSGPLNRVDGEDSVPITVEDFGSGTLYWGTSTQTTDSDLAGTGLGHPAYRGLAYMVFPHARLGQNTDTVPNFEVVASRWGNVPDGWSRGPASNLLDVNPVVAVGEVLTSRRLGRGVPVAWLNVDDLSSFKIQLDAEGFSLSPILDTGVTLRQFLADICDYVGGWYRIDDLGRLSMGLFRGGSSGAMISESTMTAEPVITPGSWSATASAAQVSYTNSQRYWMREVVTGVDGANALITGQFRQPVIERPWVTDPAIAARMADVIAQRNGRPWAKGRLMVRPSRVVGIGPASLRRLSYGHLGLVGQPVRVLSVDMPAPGKPEIGLEVSFDVGAMNVVYADPPTYVPPPSSSITPIAATYQALWSLPAALGGSNNHPVIALLCAQPSKPTDSFYGHIEIGGGGYDPIVPESSSDFAIRAKVRTAALVSGDIEVILLGVDTDLGRYTTADFSQGRVVAWLSGEVMLVTGFTLISAGNYTLTGTRGAMGTSGVTHAVDDPLWLVQTERLYTKPIWTISPLYVTMKIQPSIRGVKVDLASCSAMTITADPADVGPSPPTNLKAFGSTTPTWVGSTDIPVTWTPTEPFGPMAVVLEFWDNGGTPALVATVNLPVGAVEYLWPYSTAVAAMGGTAATFTVHAKHRSGVVIGSATVITVTR